MESKNFESWRIALRIGILLALLSFLYLFLTVPKTDCQACEIKVEGKEITIEEFMKLYFETCVYPYKLDLNPLDLNFSDKVKAGGMG